MSDRTPPRFRQIECAGGPLDGAVFSVPDSVLSFHVHYPSPMDRLADCAGLYARQPELSANGWTVFRFRDPIPPEIREHIRFD